MTPKEKAKELFEKFRIHSPVWEVKDDAKQCALIAVDEIIKCNPCRESSDRGANFSWQDNTYYWEQVKQEIINL